VGQTFILLWVYLGFTTVTVKGIVPDKVWLVDALGLKMETVTMFGRRTAPKTPTLPPVPKKLFAAVIKSLTAGGETVTAAPGKAPGTEIVNCTAAVTPTLVMLEFPDP
jgi:hypothetical protein